MALPAVARLTQMFRYLDKLRESGAINMYGARPYVQREFSLEENEARRVVKAWMETFDQKINPLSRAMTAGQRSSTE